MEQFRTKLPQLLYNVAMALEVLIGVILIGAILISIYSVVLGFQGLYENAASTNAFHDFLALAFNVVIGIEFLKMLCRHNMGSAIEVLLFAIARQMVIDHTTPLDNLLSVIAIAVLFLIRKYLFIPGLDNKHHLQPDGPAGSSGSEPPKNEEIEIH